MNFLQWVNERLRGLINSVIDKANLSDAPLIRTIIGGIIVTIALLALTILWILINPTGNSLFL